MRVRLLAAAFAGAVLVAAPPAHAADGRPPTVPALQEWRASAGTFTLGADSRVVVRGTASWLRAEARTLAADLGIPVGRRGGARSGDVVLATAPGEQLAKEAYALRVGRTFTIQADAPAGAFYGGRTLVQLERAGKPIPRGRGRDRPLYGERGMMLDAGRAFYSRPWLQALIRRMADLKLNLLHLHLSDNEGFRIASDSHPEIVSEEHLTKDDLRVLFDEARRNHVTIVPELDMPGHMTAALAKSPELQLVDSIGWRQPDKLDVTLPEGRRFVADLLDEYLPLFPGKWWHVGADEYLGFASTEADYPRYPQLQEYAREKYGPEAKGHDAVQDFVNWVGDRAAAAGKEIRVWSDGIRLDGVVPLRKGATVHWWENRLSPSPNELVERGHPVLNVGWWPLYYVTGGALQFSEATEADMYERWDAWQFDGPYTTRWAAGLRGPVSYELERGDQRQLGATMAVWNDSPDSPDAQPDAVATGTLGRLRIVAQKTWGSPLLTPSYAEFQAKTGG